MRNKKRWLAMMLAAAMTITSVGVSPLSGIDVANAATTVTATDCSIDLNEVKIPDQLQNGVNPPNLMNEPALATIVLTNGTKLTRGVDYKVYSNDVAVGNAEAIFEGLGVYKGKTFTKVPFKIVSNKATVEDVFEARVDESKIDYEAAALTASSFVASGALTVLKNDYDDVTSEITNENSREDGKCYVVVNADSTNKTANGTAGEKYIVKVLLCKDATKDKSEDVVLYNKTIAIAKKDISKANLSVTLSSASVTYDGSEKKPTITTVSDDDLGTTVKVKVDKYIDNINASTKAKVQFTADDSNYTGTATTDFTISPANLGNAYLSVDGSIEDQVYTGDEIKPVPKITAKFDKNDAGSRVIPASDYELLYSDNTNVSSSPTIQIKGKGNNTTGTSTATIPFNIVAADLKNVTIEQIKDVEAGTQLSESNFDTYFKVTYNGIKLTSASVLSSFTKLFSEVGETNKIELTGTGNFTGKKEITVTAVAKKMEATYTSPANDIVYTGKAIEPITSSLGIITVKGGSAQLQPGTEYKVTGVYANNINAGTATAQIEGVGEYAGQKATVEFTIKPLTLPQTASSYVIEGLKAGFYSEESEISGLTVKVKNGDTVLYTLGANDVTVKAKTITGNKLTAVDISGKGNYTGSVTGGVTLATQDQVAADTVAFSSATVTGEIPAGLDGYVVTSTATGKNDLRDYIDVKINGIKLDKTAYTITSISQEPGVSTTLGTLGTKVVLVLTPVTSQLSGTKKVTLTVGKADITSLKDDFALDTTSYVYSGAENKPTASQTSVTGIKGLTPADDYTVTYKNNIDVGTATAIVTGKGNYKGSFEKTFTITKKTLALSDVDVVLPSLAERAYTGTKNDLSAKISLKNKTNGKYALDKSLYTVSYVSTSTTDFKVGDTVTYKVDIKDSKNYETSTFNVTYGITVRNVTESEAAVTLDKTEIEINAAAPTTKAVVVGGKTLVAGTDYVETPKGDLTKPTSKDNETYVLVEFKGNYAGYKKVPFTVKAKEFDLSEIRIKAPTNTVYTGSPIVASCNDPLNSVTIPSSYGIVYYKDGKKLTTPPTDVGTYTARIEADTSLGYTGIGKSVTYTITPYEISDAQWKAIAFTLKNAEYAGEKTVAPVIDTFTTTTGIPSTINKTSFEVVSFDKEWDGNPLSTYKAKIATKAGANVVYKGDAKEVIFQYDAAKISSSNINDFFEIKDQVYTGNAIEPVVTAKEGSNADPSWVTVKAYSSNVNISSKSAYAEVSIDVPANASDYFAASTVPSAKIYFTIKAASIETATVEGIEDAEYTGKAITQKVEVTTADGLVLTLGKDYKVAYANNVNPGTATVTISGCGNYTGKIVKTFKITKKETPVVKTDISKATITGLKTVTYNGKAFKPVVKVVVNGKTLVLNKDYKVAYSNNIKPGTAKVVITGIGSYKGTVTKSFVIKKAAQSITKAVVSKTFKASSLKKKAATFKINAKAKGKITYKKTSGSKNITVSKSGTVTVKKGTKKGTYTIKVKITAAATSYYLSKSVTKTIKVVVK